MGRHILSGKFEWFYNGKNYSEKIYSINRFLSSNLISYYILLLFVAFIIINNISTRWVIITSKLIVILVGILFFDLLLYYKIFNLCWCCIDGVCRYIMLISISKNFYGWGEICSSMSTISSRNSSAIVCICIRTRKNSFFSSIFLLFI